MPTYNPTDSRFLTVAQSRTNNGQKDIRIILDIPTNDFYANKILYSIKILLVHFELFLMQAS